jgi:hypothetical protein
VLTPTLVGDLKNGRTVHSLVKLLSLYDVTLNFVSPPSLAMPDYVKAEASRAGVRWNEYNNLDDVIAKSDVLYATRVQKERFDSNAEYEAVKDMFVINNDVLGRAKESAIVMHPLPRVNEIDPEVDFDSRRAAYFRQMRYGLFVSGQNMARNGTASGTGADISPSGTHGSAHSRPRRLSNGLFGAIPTPCSFAPNPQLIPHSKICIDFTCIRNRENLQSYALLRKTSVWVLCCTACGSIGTG